jgi:cytochrome c-type biogenesis protein CcmH
MTAFLAAAAALAALALIVLLRPLLLRAPAPTSATVAQVNTAIYRDQLARLERDLAEGMLDKGEYAVLRAELERRALGDIEGQGGASQMKTPRRTLMALVVVVPLAAAGLYAVLGNAEAIGGHAGAPPATANAEIEEMVSKFAAKLEQNPGDKKGWVMLARSYKVMGRPLDAERAYERAGDAIDADAQELANYADVVATNSGGHFAGKPAQLIEKALRADPKNTMALWLAGAAALDRGDRSGAVLTWQRLVALLPPDSDDARELNAAIVQAGGTAVAATTVAPVANGASVGGMVELDPALRATPTDIVMVIARVPGTRMPVAVLRARARDLPLAFSLDDSLSMSPEARISMAAQVEVEARISKTGEARAQPGDLISSVQTVKVGTQSLALRVSQVRR